VTAFRHDRLAYLVERRGRTMCAHIIGSDDTGKRLTHLVEVIVVCPAADRNGVLGGEVRA
jgi:hypothetical protein